jgi:Bacterial aa3 type cytochrome c oxidase subunit IV
MDISPQKETWANFKKLTLYVSITLVFILVLMAVFLL